MAPSSLSLPVPLRILLMAAAAAAPRLASARRAPGDTRPNIILFHPDTMRAEALGTYGHPLSLTPNFDRMAAAGTLFENAHVQHSQCTPSRCAMVTGRYMHVLGHRTQTHLVRSYEDNMFKSLKGSGYTTVALGKNDVLSADSFNASFDYWQEMSGVAMGAQAYPTFPEAGFYSFANTASPANGSNPDFNADLMAVQRAVDWLASDPPEPFAFYIPGIGAHPPYGAPSDFFGKYTAADVRAKAPLRELQPGSNKPPHLGPGGITGFRNLTSFSSGGGGGDDLFYSLAAVYLGRVAYVDHLLGLLLDGLEASPLADTTALFAHSDHGDYSGDWGAVEKWPGGLEDVLTRVPLLAVIPGGVKGQRVSAPVMSIDLLPTFLELAQTNATSVHFGVSLLPWISRGVAPPKAHPYVFSEGGYSEYNEYEPNDPQQASTYANKMNMYYPRGREEVQTPLHIDRVIMMANLTSKLIYRPRGVSELYDLVADPKELFNVYGNETYAALRSDMTAGLLSWMVLTGDVTPADDDERNFPPPPANPPFPWPPVPTTKRQPVVAAREEEVVVEEVVEEEVVEEEESQTTESAPAVLLRGRLRH